MKDFTAPLFSIITITLNNHKGLEKTYRSVAAQTLQNYEWVVIDGASSDGSLEFLRGQTADVKAKTIQSEKDGGIYDAMNRGIRAAKGDYLIFMNAGDELADAGVLEMVSAHSAKKPDFIYGDALEGNPPQLKKARNYRDLPWGMFTHHQAMIYRRHTIRDLKLRYSILFDISGDYDFTARFLKGSKAMIYIAKPICVFEQGGVSQRNAALGRREQYEIREALELVSQAKNVWIYLVQSVAWRLKKASPKLYALVKNMVLGFSDRRRVKKKAKKS